MKEEKKYRYNCTDSYAPKKVISYIEENKKEITYSTFLPNVDKIDFEILAGKLGYSRSVKNGMVIRNDKHIKYYRCKIPNMLSYIMEHSSIYYIFY